MGRDGILRRRTRSGTFPRTRLQVSFPMLEPVSVQRVPSTDGVELAVYDYGGEGPDLIAGHATGFHGRVYDPMLERLPGFRRIGVDLRGHGDATAPDGLDYGWESCAEDLVAVIDALELGAQRPLFGFGHSMGAASLLMIAAGRPGLFAGLACYEPVIYPPGVTDDDARLGVWVERTRHRRRRFASREAAVANYAEKLPYSLLAPEALDAYVRHGFAPTADGAVEIKCRPEVEAQLYLMGPRHRAWDGLRRVECPVTLMRGAVLIPGPAYWAEAIVGELPNVRFLEVEGLGHLGPLEDPERMAALVAEALVPSPD